MRGVDGAPWRGICALPAFWVGLLYDESSLNASWDLVKDWSADERQELRDAVPRTALNTPFRSGTALDVARECLKIARNGLKARALQDGFGGDETQFLQIVEDVVASGRTPAERLLASYENEWGGDIDKLFMAEAF